MIYKISTDSAPIKAQPLANGNIITRLSINTKLEVTDISNRWASFIYDNKEAYISTMYITICPSTIVGGSELENTNKNIEEVIIDEEDISKLLKGNITIKYIDTINKLSLSNSISYNDLELDTYTYNAIDLVGYKLYSPNTQEIILDENNLNPVVTFEYEKILGKITIKYINHDEETEISTDTIYDNLDLNTYNFNSKQIYGYFSLATSPYEISLTENKYENIITFEYKKILGKVIVRYIDIFTREDIFTPDTFTNLELDNYIYNSKDIEGYIIVCETSKSIDLDETLNNYEIYFEYRIIK